MKKLILDSRKKIIEAKNRLTKFCKLCYSGSRRRHYPVQLCINGKRIDIAVIDPHYELKHSRTVNDGIILSLLKDLDNAEFEPEEVDEDDFEYYSTGPHYYENRTYKLIWLLPSYGAYIGVINCYRRSYEK